ncbi:MAG: 2-dehydro-3-deoxyglucarate aldolase [Planctomycetes bacterium]|nr:2-dehydro-3-deoxyglucarate aldolase [Planctomycetota bacterium]MBL7143458.1 2-dehydro-3-deoxyglucarate aldolase [Phycisphaerae bacterium]
MKNIKARIYNGETLIGCWLNLGSSLTSEIVGMSGFDWVLIDIEHGSGSEAQILQQLQALEHTPAATFVRVESYQRQRFHRILDLGAEGIMCPRINTLEEARQAAKAIRYPPDGIRGVARMVRATNFGSDFSEYYANQKKNLVCIVQIETEEILNSLDSVAAIDEIDVLFVGPMDLSIALGVFGQPDHPRFMDALKATADAAAKKGKAAGILLQNPEEFKKYYELGFRFIACSSDSSFVQIGARKMAESLNELKNSHETGK